MNKHDGTFLRCSCESCQGRPADKREVLAGANLTSGQVELLQRRHGTDHNAAVSLSTLVAMLDPRGTSFAPVGSAR